MANKENMANIGSLLTRAKNASSPIGTVEKTPLDEMERKPAAFKSPGRPAKREAVNGIMTTTAKVQKDTYLKAKQIAHDNNLSVSELINFGLSYVIGEYEKKYGEIRISEKSENSIDSILGL